MQEGARLVARAWLDAEFKVLLLRDGLAAARQLGAPLQACAQAQAMQHAEYQALS